MADGLQPRPVFDIRARQARGPLPARQPAAAPMPDPATFFQPDTTPAAQPATAQPHHSLRAGRNGAVLLAVGLIIIFSGLTIALRRHHVPHTQTPVTPPAVSTVSPSPSVTFNDNDAGASLTPPPPTSPAPAPSPPPSTSPGPSPAPAPSPAPSPSPTPTPPPSTPVTHTVTYTSGGCYTPGTVTIKNGDVVKFVNSSNKTMAPHAEPQTAYPAFVDSGTAPGGSWSFTFAKTGSFFYRDKNKSACSGTVVVK